MVEYAVFSAGVLRLREDSADGNGRKEIESLLRDVVLQLSDWEEDIYRRYCNATGFDFGVVGKRVGLMRSFVSEYVLREAARGEPEQARLRLEAIRGISEVDRSLPEIAGLAKRLLDEHAVPQTEVMDAYHIATAAVHGMDVLLTWNCKHMANRFALPRTIVVVAKAGYACPAIVTPEDYMKEALDEQSV